MVFLQFLPFTKINRELFTTPEEFVELAHWAYAKTGCRPINGRWRDGNGRCVLGALGAAFGSDSGDEFSFLSKKFNRSQAWLAGVMQAFDGGVPDDTKDEIKRQADYMDGYRYGLAARKEFIEA